MGLVRYAALRRTTWPSSSTSRSGWCAAKTAGCERARLLKALRPYSRSIALAGRRQCLPALGLGIGLGLVFGLGLGLWRWLVAASACPR